MGFQGIYTGTSFYVETKRPIKLVEKVKQLATSEQKVQYLRRKMTVGVTDVLSENNLKVI